MSDPQLSSDLLSRLKDKIEPLRDNPHGRFVTVSVAEMAALIECAELLDSVIEAQFTHAGQSGWLGKRKAVLAKLEAL